MYWTVHSFDGSRQVINHAAVAIGACIFTFGGFYYDDDDDDDDDYYGADNFVFRQLHIDVLDTVKLKWLKLEPNANQDIYCVPFQRYGHTVVANSSKIYLWGGGNGPVQCNILYCYNTETQIWSRPDVIGNIPLPRDGHSACIIQNCMYIFGGFQANTNQFSQDLYMLNLDIMVWSIVQTGGNPPSHRDLHTATAIDKKMYIFGGRGDRHGPRQTGKEIYCGEIYYFDTSTKMWVCPTVNGHIPLGRHSHSAFVHNGYMYTFSGFNKIMNMHFQDINRYDPKSSTWMKISPKGISPCARRSPICVVVNDKVYISGGAGPEIYSLLIDLRINNFDVITQTDSDTLEYHDDLHVLDLNPSLIDMCLVSVWENIEKMKINVEDLPIPLSLKNELDDVDPRE